MDSTRAVFSSRGEIIFVGGEPQLKHIYRMKEDGTGLRQVSREPAIFLYGVSPDAKWAAAWMAGPTERTLNSLVVQPLESGSASTVCIGCATAAGPERGHRPPLLSWSPDGKFVYPTVGESGTYAVPLRPGQVLPPLPPSGLQSSADMAALPGARLVSPQRVFGGPDPSIYAFSRVATHRNIYRIPVR